MSNGKFKRLTLCFKCGNCGKRVNCDVEESDLLIDHDEVHSEWTGAKEIRYSIHAEIDCPKCGEENWIPIRTIEYADPDF